jgi:hypothetical protein
MQTGRLPKWVTKYKPTVAYNIQRQPLDYQTF